MKLVLQSRRLWEIVEKEELNDDAVKKVFQSFTVGKMLLCQPYNFLYMDDVFRLS